MISISLGDPWGIGPELIVRALSERPNEKIRICASKKLVQALAEKQSFESYWPSLMKNQNLRFCDEVNFDCPKPNDELGRARVAKTSLDLAIAQCKDGVSEAMVTAPLDKKVQRTIDPTFTGHTGYLQEQCQVPYTIMLLSNRELNVVVLTHHIPLRDVPGVLTRSYLQENLERIYESFQHHLQRKPRMALCALNPHAGEFDEESEEKKVFWPVLAELKNRDLSIEGPFPADSFFPTARAQQKWDVVVCPYHDQGLVAAKYPGFDQVVNITLGLPFLRVSPGHGTAYDQVGKGTATIGSFVRALDVAKKGSWL